MNYPALLTAISDAHRQAQAGAAGAVNRHLVLRNWRIGAHLVEFEQSGEDRAEYGAGLLKRVSADLRERQVPGVSPDRLERMRLLYLHYPQMAAARISGPEVRNLPPAEPPPTPENDISAPVVRKSGDEHRTPRPLPVEKLLELSWTHLADLVRLEDPWKRAFYENECLKGQWSKRQLQRQIGSLLYERSGLSSDKEAVIERARQQALETPGQIADLIRDPYVIEFTGLAERAHYLEADLEKALLDHLQAFLLELGAGFCFEARQRRITVGNEHHYLDLVFYHRLLRCHLLIDLKIRPFRHGDAGQMNFYLNYWKAQVMAEGEQPPVGLLLCTDEDQTKVEPSGASPIARMTLSRHDHVTSLKSEIRGGCQKVPIMRVNFGEALLLRARQVQRVGPAQEDGTCRGGHTLAGHFHELLLDGKPGPHPVAFILLEAPESRGRFVGGDQPLPDVAFHRRPKFQTPVQTTTEAVRRFRQPPDFHAARLVQVTFDDVGRVEINHRPLRSSDTSAVESNRVVGRVPGSLFGNGLPRRPAPRVRLRMATGRPSSVMTNPPSAPARWTTCAVCSCNSRTVIDFMPH